MTAMALRKHNSQLFRQCPVHLPGRVSVLQSRAALLQLVGTESRYLRHSYSIDRCSKSGQLNSFETSVQWLTGEHERHQIQYYMLPSPPCEATRIVVAGGFSVNSNDQARHIKLKNWRPEVARMHRHVAFAILDSLHPHLFRDSSLC
jgi:hypothetical protein